jgi:hypothetical protein
MKDADLRGIVLRKLYEVRREGMTGLPVDDGLLTPATSFDICRQLAQQSLIEFRAIEGIGGFRDGMVHITAYGVDVVEGTTRAPIAINIDQSVSVHSSQNVQIGKSNVQGIQIDAERLAVAIDNAEASLQEKAEAKSLLKKLLENPIVSKIIASWFPKV